MPFTYGDIPNSEVKPYIPIMTNIWKIFTELGWKYLFDTFKEISLNVYKLAFERLKSTVDTAKLIMAEKMDGTKVVNYSLSPPFYTIRNDMQSGSMKLVYGESVDSTFIVCNNFTEKPEIGLLMNCHLEDGWPVDWWTVAGDDELLDRRHLKLGIKLRDLPANGNMSFVGWKARQILQDIRNERSPHWADSPYFTGPNRMAGALNCLLETSNYELFFHLYNAYNSKRLYGMKDLIFDYTPFPSLLKTATFMDQPNFVLRTVGLTTGLFWSVQGFHESNINYFTENFAELWEVAMKRRWEKDGIPIPQTTLDWRYPYMKEKQDLVKKLTRVSKKDAYLTIDQLGIDLEDAYKGVFLDYTYEDPPETLSHDRIISFGMGKEAKILKTEIETVNRDFLSLP